MLAIVPIRPGDHNPELRFATRSIAANLPQVTELWTVGHCPTWLQPDRHIPGNQHQTGQANVYNNILTGCTLAAECGATDILISNDDIYITAPIDQVPVLYRGTLTDHLNLPRVRRARGQWWPTSLTTTQLVLQAHGIPEPLSYELHTPYPCNPNLMADTLTLMRHVTPNNPPQWRSLYRNLHGMGGKQHTDGKAYKAGPIRYPYHSTEDRSWPYFAHQLAELFPTPSRYESDR